jgi:HK97 family phage prohead protease
MSDREFRFVPADAVEIRSDGEDGVHTLTGTAPPYNVLSVDLGGFREKFAPGAFGDSLEGDVISTFEHDGRMILGRTTAGTLRLEEQKRGLRYAVDLPDTTAGRDLAVSVDRGDVAGSSFEFRVRAGGEEWDEKKDGSVTRTVTDAELFQVGPVTQPAYPRGTKVALRSLEEWREGQKPEGTRLLDRARRLLRLLRD